MSSKVFTINYFGSSKIIGRYGLLLSTIINNHYYYQL